MADLKKKLLSRKLRINRVRSRVQGTAKKPRLAVFISNTNVSAQLIDDDAAHTLASVTTVGSKQSGPLSKKAEWIGSELAKKASKVNIKKVVFDRHGRQYAGRLKALADSARKEGLEF